MASRRSNLDLNVQCTFLCYIRDCHNNIVVYEVLSAFIYEHGSTVLAV